MNESEPLRNTSSNRDANQKPFASFSVRTFAIVVSLVCLLLGWFAHSARNQETIISQIRQLGGSVRLRDNRPSTLRTKMLGRSFFNPVTAVSLDRQADYSFLAGLSGLQELSLTGPEITDISGLAELNELTQLTLLSIGDADLEPVAGLTKLDTLDLGGSLVADISPLAALQQLKTLSLADTSVRDVSAVARMTSLDRLYLNRTPVADIRPLAALRQLTVLQLDWTLVDDITPLESIERLNSLSLVGCSVRDLSPLSSLESLHQLFIAGAPIENMEPLLSVANLRGLSVDTKQTESPQLAELRNQKPRFAIGQYISATPTQPQAWVPTPQSAVAALDSLPPNSELEETLQRLGLQKLQALWGIQLTSRTTLTFKPPEGYLMLFFIRENPHEHRRVLKRVELLPRGE